MEAISFLLAVKRRELSKVIHRTPDELDSLVESKKLSQSRRSIIDFVAAENYQRRVVTGKKMRSRYNKKALSELVSGGYIFSPSIMEIGKIFFKVGHGYIYAERPVYDVFYPMLAEFDGHRYSKSWREKFADPRATLYPRAYFAAVSIDDAPAYWKYFYKLEEAKKLFGNLEVPVPVPCTPAVHMYTY